MHDIGKNLVGMMLEGAGFDVQDLGADVHPSKFVAAVEATQPDVVALSALLTTTMPSMKATIDALATAGLRPQVKIMIGGAPVNQEYADVIGADGYAQDASQAAALAKALIGR
jgi:5-methyltetrahydrofolate--homocysteine methyltransferase